MDSLNEVSYLLSTGTDHDQANGQSVSKRYLVNRLNYLNFQDRSILINFKHKKYGNIISHPANPLPCSGERLDCVWIEKPDVARIMQSYALENMLIADGKKLLLVKPEMLTMGEKGVEFLLPESCSEVGSRKVKRHECRETTARVIQSGVLMEGVLRDFSPLSMRLEVSAAPPQALQWVNPDFPVHLHISVRDEILYSGDCRIIRNTGDPAAGVFVLEPVHYHMRRFRPKKYRSTRQELVPAPSIVFAHPFTGKTVNLRVLDLSGTGFSVEEDEENAVLLAGMILPRVELSIAASCQLACNAQVVYRHVDDAGEGKRVVKCGLAILDMDAGDHIKLLSLLHHAANRNSYICTSVDMDALWNFFFDAGFIYPEKYAFFQANKETMKRTYERLYSHCPHIARHFIYQDKGAIHGHMAMVRFYGNSWLIHHHAASRSQYMRAGLNVLNQIGRFVNDSHNLYSAHMHYVFCYYRPDNKFPDRVFGGLARQLKDPAGCSLDTFAYFHFQRPFQKGGDLPVPWELSPTQPADLEELKSFYGQDSGGLMLKALDLEPEAGDRNRLSEEYRTLNFKRESHLLSLKKNDSLRAVIMIDISDVGLNMSNLTNCAKVVVLDGDGLPKEVLSLALSHASAHYEQSEMPVLVYPVAYAESQAILYEKLYTMWVLNMQYTDQYFGYLESLIKSVQY